jgi:hypothetical protein
MIIYAVLVLGLFSLLFALGLTVLGLYYTLR